MKKVMKDIFLKLMFNTPQNYKNFIMTYQFYLKEYNLEKSKTKYGENAKFCYMHADNFIVHVKTDDIYKDVVDVEKRFGTSNFETDRLLPLAKNKKVIGLMKGELGGQIKKEFVRLRAKNI